MTFFQKMTVLFLALALASHHALGAAIDSDPYRVLGLERGASWLDARAQYKLSLKHHPDKGGDAETFKAVAAALRAIEKEL